MADTPGIVRYGTREIQAEESAAAAQNVDYEAAVQALSLEALGTSVNAPSEADMGLVSAPIFAGWTTSDGKSNYLTLAILAGLVYFLFIKKGKRK